MTPGPNNIYPRQTKKAFASKVIFDKRITPSINNSGNSTTIALSEYEKLGIGCSLIQDDCKSIVLDDWDEIVGIILDVFEFEDSFSVSLYVSSTGDKHKINLPGKLSKYFSDDITTITTGVKIGILRVPGDIKSFRIRAIEGGQ